MNFDIITLIKCIAIIYTSIIDIFIGIAITHLTDKYLFKNIFKKDDNKSNINLILLIFQIGFIIGCLIICSYFARNLLELIPFPLDHFFGFNYDQIKEVRSGNLLNIAILLYSITLQSKIVILKNILNKLDNN